MLRALWNLSNLCFRTSKLWSVFVYTKLYDVHPLSQMQRWRYPSTPSPLWAHLPDSNVSDPNPHWFWSAGSGRAKMTHKNRKKLRNLMFWSAGCSLLRAEGFFYSLEVFYGGLGISKLQFLIRKILIIFSAVNFSNFWSSKSWIWIRSESASGFALT
jgi:hypothetical protein